MKPTSHPKSRALRPVFVAAGAAFAALALSQVSPGRNLELGVFPAPGPFQEAPVQADGEKLPEPPVTASMRLEGDPAFTPPPKEIPVVADCELVSFLHSSGAVARKGYLKEGARTGLWISWHADGREATRGAYADYKQVGPWVFTEEDGTRVEGQFDEQGRRQGLWRTFTPKGQLRLRAFWKDDLPTSTFEWFNKTGLRAAYTTYANGIREGMSCRYGLTSGLPIEQGAWVKGRQEGPWRTWHANGQLSTEGRYSRGQKVGPWVAYHDNGRRYRVGSYVDGLKSGEWVGFFKRGEREFIGTYQDGALNGPYTGFWPNGDKRGKGSYANGVFEGPWTFWDRNGQLDPSMTGTYRGGDLVR